MQNILHKDKICFGLINFSRNGYDSKRCLDIYRRVNKIPHKIVLYCLHLNDLILFGTSYVVCIDNFYDYTKWTGKSSRLIDFILKRIQKQKSRQKKIQELTNPLRFKDSKFINNIAAIKQMNIEAKQNGVDFYVVILPILIDIQKTTFKPVYNKIIEILNENNINYFDISSSVSSYRDSELWILPFDQHPNEIANAIFAQKLSIFLKDIRGFSYWKKADLVVKFIQEEIPFEELKGKEQEKEEKEIIEEKFNLWLWVVIGLVVVLVIGVIVRYKRKKRRRMFGF